MFFVSVSYVMCACLMASGQPVYVRTVTHAYRLCYAPHSVMLFACSTNHTVSLEPLKAALTTLMVPAHADCFHHLLL